MKFHLLSVVVVMFSAAGVLRLNMEAQVSPNGKSSSGGWPLRFYEVTPPIGASRSVSYRLAPLIANFSIFATIALFIVYVAEKYIYRNQLFRNRNVKLTSILSLSAVLFLIELPFLPDYLHGAGLDALILFFASNFFPSLVLLMIFGPSRTKTSPDR